MGRSPCCQKEGLKKGPWTSEEDQTLVSFIALHGHGNWRALPSKCGLLRCGKSCRLRWTNYLRPDIKRGGFSEDEENKIIQLHAIGGNKWAMIASHLPQRTDNEIKNHWNTVLKKRLQKKDLDRFTYLQDKSTGSNSSSDSNKLSSSSSSISHLAQWESVRLETEARLAKESEMTRATGVWPRIISRNIEPSTDPVHLKSFPTTIIGDQTWIQGNLPTTTFSLKERSSSNSTSYSIETGSGRSSLCSPDQNSNTSNDKISWNWDSNTSNAKISWNWNSLDQLSKSNVITDFQRLLKPFPDTGLHSETRKLDSTLCYPTILALEDATTRTEVDTLDNACPSLEDLQDLLFEDDNDSCSKRQASSRTDGSKQCLQSIAGGLEIIQTPRMTDSLRIMSNPELYSDDDCSDSGLHEAISRANEIAGALSREIFPHYDLSLEESATNWNNLLMQLLDSRTQGDDVSEGES